MEDSLTKICNIGLESNCTSLFENLVNDITIYGSPLIFISYDKGYERVDIIVT